MEHMKGQASMELLVTVSMIIAFTVPVVLMLLVSSQIGLEDATIFQAQASAKTLADSINQVYTEGIGSKKIIMISLPGATNNLIIKNHEVLISLTTSNGQYQYGAPFYAVILTPKEISGKGLVIVKLETIKDKNNQPVVNIE